MRDCARDGSKTKQVRWPESDCAQTHQPETTRSLLNLAPATVSLVLNRSRVADTIPQETKNRILAAVEKYNYRPSFLARTLRAQRSFTIGVLVPEVSEGYSACVMSGVEDHSLQAGYFYLVASHRHRADLVDEYPRMFMERSVDGIIAVDTPWTLSISVPVVTVSGHNKVKGVTNIILDHSRAALNGRPWAMFDPQSRNDQDPSEYRSIDHGGGTVLKRRVPKLDSAASIEP